MTSLIEDNDTPATPKLEDLMGEGKKYRDPDAVAKALLEKDSYITRVEKEAEEARSELRARLTLEELSEKIFQKAPTQPNPVTPPQEAGREKKEDIPPVDVAELVRKELEGIRATDNRNKNLAAAKTALKERFGGDYPTAIKNIAEKISVGVDFLESMAAQSPTAFLQLVDSVQPKDDRRPVAPPNSSFDPSRSTQVSGVKNNKYYQELRRKDPKLYFSKQVQAELYKEAVAQGAKFYE